jgi:hypothetical protein
MKQVTLDAQEEVVTTIPLALGRVMNQILKKKKKRG